MAKGSTGTSMGGTIEYVSFKEVNKARRQQQAKKREAAKKREQTQKQKHNQNQKQKKDISPKEEKQRKHCYGVHFLDNDEKTIIMSWNECQARMKGRTNRFKGFQSVEEAQTWLDGGVDHEKKTLNSTPHKENVGTVGENHSRVNFCISLSRSEARKLRRLAQSMNFPAETLVQNLVLEYLFDLEKKDMIPPDSDEPPF